MASFDKYIYLNIIHPLHLQIELNALIVNLAGEIQLIKKRLNNLIIQMDYCDDNLSIFDSERNMLSRLIMAKKLKLKLTKIRLSKVVERFENYFS